MSEPIPESIPTSADPRSKRPTKRRILGPGAQHSASVEALFAKPDQNIHIPITNPKNSSLPPPPEIVANVQGSSAGAGSGEFHVYKASRRREQAREREMFAAAKREEEEAELAKKQAEEERKIRAREEARRTGDLSGLTGKEKKAIKDRERAKKRKNMSKRKAGSATPIPEGVADGPPGLNSKPNPNIKANGPRDMEHSTENGAAENAVEEIGIIIHDED